MPSNMRQAWKDKCHIIYATLKRPTAKLKRAERTVAEVRQWVTAPWALRCSQRVCGDAAK